MTSRVRSFQALLAVLVLGVTFGVRAADEPVVTSITEIAQAMPAELFPPKDKPLSFAVLKPLNEWLEKHYNQQRTGKFTVQPTERQKVGNTAIAREVSEFSRDGMKLVQHVQIGVPVDQAEQLSPKRFVAEGIFRADVNVVTGKDKVKRIVLMVTLREPKILPAEK